MSSGFDEYRQAFWDACVCDMDEQGFIPAGLPSGDAGTRAVRALYMYSWLYAPDADMSEVLSAAGRHIHFVPGGAPDVLMRASRPSGGGKRWNALVYGTDEQDVASRMEAFADAVSSLSGTLPRSFLSDSETWATDSPSGGGLHVLVSGDEPLGRTDFARVSAALDTLAGVAGRHLSSEVFGLRHAYSSQMDEPAAFGVELRFSSATLSGTGDVMVGTVPLPSLYGFMSDFERRTHSVHMLYDENIRFEKPGSRVNSGMVETLRSDPASFGVYNNGLVIVVRSAEWDPATRTATLVSPQIVNGCQTSRAVYRHVRDECVYGGSPLSVLDGGFVQVKVISVPGDGTREGEARRRDELRAITRYANTQNRVRDIELIRHDPRMREMRLHLAQRGVHLELQGGSWSPSMSAAYPGGNLAPEEALRVLAAAFLATPGNAYGRPDKLMPGGSRSRVEDVVAAMGGYDLPETGEESLYGQMMSLGPACVDAAIELRSRQQAEYSASAAADRPSMTGTQYLFYHAAARILVGALSSPGSPVSPRDLAEFVSEPANAGTVDDACSTAARILAEYMGDPGGVYRNEPLFAEKASDRGRFLRAPELGMPDGCPHLSTWLSGASKGVLARMEAREAGRES